MTSHIALFGGSFDPPHLGHQALVHAALEKLNIDTLYLLPTGIPVHKELSGHASAEQRKTWLMQMFEGDSRIRILDWEIARDKPSPAIDSLRRFQAEFPEHIPTWLMGMDSFLDLPNWVEYPEHANLCNLAVFSRKGTERQEFATSWEPIPLQAWQSSIPSTAGHVVLLEEELPEVSATAIRQNPEGCKQLLNKITCNDILACYASPLTHQKRE